MFSLFSQRPPVDEDEFDWLIACFAWLNRCLDEGQWSVEAELVLPSDRFFALSGATGDAFAQEIFGQVKSICGMDDWPCRLIEGERRRASRLQAGLALRHQSHAPLGTFSVRDEVFISYDPALVDAPHNLIATFAHELAHYLIAGLGDPPGGPDLHEHATDCTAAYLGFGVFLANASFQFAQFSNFGEMGWETRQAGYLSEAALVTATALFVHFAASDPAEAERAFKSNLRKPFRRAMKAVSRRFPDGADGLKSVDLAAWG